jgi:hypothetical protein
MELSPQNNSRRLRINSHGIKGFSFKAVSREGTSIKRIMKVSNQGIFLPRICKT